MWIPFSPLPALVFLTLTMTSVMADTADSGTPLPIQKEEKEKKTFQFQFKLTPWLSPNKATTYILRDNSFPYPKDYMLQDYLTALEEFLEEQQAKGMPLEKITCFSTLSLGRAKDIQEKFKQLAREGKSRVSKKDGHYMNVCARLVREEKLLAPYKEAFKRFGLEVDDALFGESKMARASLDAPGRKSPVYYFTGGMVNLKLTPLKSLEQKTPSYNAAE